MKSGLKPGGQFGHKGVTLESVDASKVDEVQFYRISCCEHCGKDLANELPCDYECRQEFEIPTLKPQVIAHQAEIRRCVYCGLINRARFPDGMTQAAQYGKRLKAIAVYLNQYQFIPYERLRELFKDLFSVSLSKGTLFNINEACCQRLEQSCHVIKEKIIQSAQAHFDESSVKVSGRLHWLHVASTNALTYYEIHPKRGAEAIEALGILSHFKGCATHDYWRPYFKYEECHHSLCNAHHLRELDYITETYGLTWSETMKRCLLEIKKAVDERKLLGFKGLEKILLHSFEKKYSSVLTAGFKEVLNAVSKQPIREHLVGGKPKQHPAKNLLDRLALKRKETLRFMYDFAVPFTNNQGEQDIRMIKVKQKISGCFRSQQGGEVFCRIKSYVSTLKKHSLPILEAIANPTATVSVLFPVTASPP